MRALCGNVRGPMAAGQYIHTFQSLARMADRLYISRRNTPTASSSSCACSMRTTVDFGISMPFKDLSEEVPAFLSRRRRLRCFLCFFPPLMFLPLADAIHPHITQVTKNCLSHAQRSPGSCLSHAHQGTENGCVSGLEQMSTESMRFLYTFM